MSERRVVYRREFFLDAASTTRWYDERQPGLGQRFLDALDRGRNGIKSNAESWPIVEDDIRVCPLRRFPYGVYFRATPDELVILGVLHLHRDAQAWKDRLSDEEAG